MRFPFPASRRVSGVPQSAACATEQTRYRDLAERGQSPETMVIGCCDSRVSPEVIFDAGPGELFVVRNVANLVPPYSPDSNYHGVSAALEFARRRLKVQAHRGSRPCSLRRHPGVRRGRPAAVSGDFIGKWMSLIAPAAATVGPPANRPHAEYLEQLEKASVGNSLASLMTFPHVRALVEQGALTLHGAYFGVATGQLAVRDPATGRFDPV